MKNELAPAAVLVSLPALPSVRVASRAARSLPTVVGALTLALTLGACDGHVSVHAHPAPPPPPPSVVWSESEPNDAAWLAPWFGSMYPGESILVEGFSIDDGSDPQDGLAFTGYGPCRIDFRLYVDDPWTDLDVWLYDADLDAFVGAYTLPYGDETGTFWIDGLTNFHLVVVPAYGASWWTLEVEASGSGYAALSASGGLPELPEGLRRYRTAPDVSADPEVELDGEFDRELDGEFDVELDGELETGALVDDTLPSVEIESEKNAVRDAR